MSEKFPATPNWAPLPEWDPNVGERMHAAWAAVVEHLWTLPGGVQVRDLVQDAMAAGRIQAGTAYGLIQDGYSHGYLRIAEPIGWTMGVVVLKDDRRVALTDRFRRHLAKPG